MAKSWKKLVKPTESDSQKESGEEGSLEQIQLTLEEIASQNEEINQLLKERQSLETEMNSLVHTGNPEHEDPRFSGNIESFKTKRKQENLRTEQKKKLEERIALKNKELEKWTQSQNKLKEKLAYQKKLLQKKETEKETITERKTKKTKDPEPEFNRKNETEKSDKKWFDTNFVRKTTERIEEKKRRLKEQFGSLKKSDSINKLDLKKPKAKTEDIPLNRPEQKTLLDRFQLKDLQKLNEKLNLDKLLPKEKFSNNSELEKKPREKKQDQKKINFEESFKKGERLFSEFNRPKKKENEPTAVSERIRSVKDQWKEKSESKREELKEKIGLQKLSEKLQEAKRFNSLPKLDNQVPMDFQEFKMPEIKDLISNPDKPFSLDERQKKMAESTSAKKEEQKENERREQLKEESLSKKRAERKEEERLQRNKERKKEKYT